MRNFLIICLVILGITSQAQIREDITFTSDTLTNAETIYFTSSGTTDDVKKNSTYAWQVKADSLTGTQTSVIAFLQHSVLDDQWVTISTADTLINSGNTASGTAIFTGTSTPAVAYRVGVVQVGTATTRVTSRAYFKKPE